MDTIKLDSPPSKRNFDIFKTRLLNQVAATHAKLALHFTNLIVNYVEPDFSDPPEVSRPSFEYEPTFTGTPGVIAEKLKEHRTMLREEYNRECSERRKRINDNKDLKAKFCAAEINIGSNLLLNAFKVSLPTLRSEEGFSEMEAKHNLLLLLKFIEKLCTSGNDRVTVIIEHARLESIAQKLQPLDHETDYDFGIRQNSAWGEVDTHFHQNVSILQPSNPDGTLSLNNDKSSRIPHFYLKCSERSVNRVEGRNTSKSDDGYCPICKVTSHGKFLHPHKMENCHGYDAGAVKQFADATTKARNEHYEKWPGKKRSFQHNKSSSSPFSKKVKDTNSNDRRPT